VTNEEFGWLVTRLETRAANAPRAFRVQVFLISIAAYVVLGLSLILFALLPAVFRQAPAISSTDHALPCPK